MGISFALVGFEDTFGGAVPFSAMIAVMCIGVPMQKIIPQATKRLSGGFGRLWVFFEIMLFVLVGACVNIKYAAAAGLPAAAMIFAVLLFRMAGVCVCTAKSRLSPRERLFCMLAYLPKATVQAAIGGIPLALGLLGFIGVAYGVTPEQLGSLGAGAIGPHVIASLGLPVFIIALYNKLVKLRNMVDNAWAQIDVQLKRRHSLIPNLIETVKGYATHERGVFESVTTARAETLSATSPAEASAAEDHMQSALKSVFAVAEAYPQLQASQNFLQLQGELVDTEDKIQAARRFYNGGVRELNTKIKVFPNNLFAKRLGFSEREFFEVSEPAAIAEPPRVQF